MRAPCCTVRRRPGHGLLIGPVFFGEEPTAGVAQGIRQSPPTPQAVPRGHPAHSGRKRRTGGQSGVHRQSSSVSLSAPGLLCTEETLVVVD